METGAIVRFFYGFRLPLSGRTRMYLKKTSSSAAGNTASHLKQATSPRCDSPADCIEIILYSAPQLGQLNEIGSALFMVEI
jgi:hypothetical protein